MSDGENEEIDSFDLDVQERMLVFRDMAALRSDVRFVTVMMCKRYSL